MDRLNRAQVEVPVDVRVSAGAGTSSGSGWDPSRVRSSTPSWSERCW